MKIQTQKTKLLLTLSVAVAFQTFGTFAMSRTMSSHPLSQSIRKAEACRHGDASYTDACIAFNNPKDHDFYGAPSLERPVCAATKSESITLAIPLCGHGCYLEGEEKALPQQMCKNVQIATKERPQFVCLGAIKIHGQGKGPQAYAGVSLQRTEGREKFIQRMLTQGSAVRGACDGELEDL